MNAVLCDNCSAQLGAEGDRLIVSEIADRGDVRGMRKLDFCDFECLSQWAYAMAPKDEEE